MSLARVQTLISAYRAWKCPMLAHYPLILGSLSPIIVVRVATPGCHHLRGTGRMGGCIDEILGRSILPLRKDNIGRRKRRRITAIILAKELPRSYQNLNQAFAGYE